MSRCTRFRLTPRPSLLSSNVHPSRAVKRQLEMQFVDAAHHRQIAHANDRLGL